MKQTAIVPKLPDRLTLIAISAIAYLIAVALHEHLGHALTCILVGSQPTELGAFYVDCDYSTLNDLAIRLVALAGPVVSLLTGLVSFLVLQRLSPAKPARFYFVWLLGTIGFMTATGYLLFSGITGIGDFGTTRDGAFYQATPAWLWQIALTVLGAASYFLIVWLAVRTIEPIIPGAGRSRITYARHLVLLSYLTGAALYIGIGLFNPHGLIIVLISSAASSLGGTSGFLWMMQLIRPTESTATTALPFPRQWSWIVVGIILTVAYALILGPTLQP